MENTLINSNNLDLKVILKGQYNLPKHTGQDSIDYFMYEVKLKNNSDSPFEFLAYSCSTAGIIVFDKNYVRQCAMNCGGNSKTVITLKAGQEFSIPILLKVNQIYNHTKVKIGLILLKPNRENFFNLARLLDRKSLKDVLWSDPFELTMDGYPYEIR